MTEQQQSEQGPFALDLSMRLKAWVSTPQFYRGKGVICELRLVNDKGMTAMVAMNRLRVLHLAMLHLGYQCTCEAALRDGRAIDGFCRVLSLGTGGMTEVDWVGVAAMFWAALNEEGRDDARQEQTMVEMTGKHRSDVLIATRPES